MLFYHGDVGWIPGGFLGVDVFFVISGYLITCLLLGDWRQQGRIGFGRFYLRRARRLLPALFLMLGVVSLYRCCSCPTRSPSCAAQVIAAIAYVENWWLIFHDVSYFVAAGRPPLLRHLWSLAVEEQFYLFWPVHPRLPASEVGPRAQEGDRRGRWRRARVDGADGDALPAVHRPVARVLRH